MPGRRTPTAILDARGAYLNHPERKRDGEPKSTRPIGGPPKDFSDELKKVWREQQKRLLPGVATFAHRTMFTLLVKLVHKMETDSLSFQGINILVSLSGRFGMTPADQARLTVETPKESKLSKFLNKPKSTANATTPAVRQQLQ
jgi:hypothetical protein